ncbi:uncharacterized protein C18orf63-like [Epargyreus clarus]|uniref:uncharacterized protein C18orf63-like n=1 Tax=Epargyreus clarus TaxID=520877 RepID=UPI003C2DC991
MQDYLEYKIINPKFDNIGYVTAMANLKEKHDRSAPSNYHWKILKCRMIIFSNSSIMACPDKSDVKKVHIIFNKVGKDYDQLNSLFLKFTLVQDGVIMKAPLEMYQMCFQYTLSARIAPTWNTLGYNYYINNRHFLTTKGPQEGVKYNIIVDDYSTILQIKPVKINLMQSEEKFSPGEYVPVLPSLNKAIIDDYYESLPHSGDFKSYKDLRRHWKNIHGYRLPDSEYPYYTVRFWRGDPFTYPNICLIKNFPIITTMPKSVENVIIARFINCLRYKMSHFLGIQLSIARSQNPIKPMELMDTQNISLCTPTQK